MRSSANTERGTQYYVNIASIVVADRYDANGVSLGTGSANTLTHGTTTTVGGLMVRDMGRSLRVPVNTLSSTVAGTKYRVLRKVQLLDTTSMSTAAAGTNDGVSSVAGGTTGLLAGGTFWIELGGTKADGTASACLWARVNIPN
jgi:hypothetical protein